MATVDLIDPAGQLGEGDRSWFSRTLGAVLTELGVPGEVRVKVVADAEMADAHERFGKVAGTTDVLTFDLSGDASLLDVDILVCADEAKRQSASRGHGWTRELLLYAVHGVLHCLGEDDREESAHARMHAREDALLKAAGVGVVFDRPVVDHGRGVAG